MAHKKGNGYFETETGNEKALHEKYKLALGQALQTLEKAVTLACNLADDEALQHLQS